MKSIFLSMLAVATFLEAESSPCYPTECCPPPHFETLCGFGIHVTAEGLYWVAKENGLIIAQKGAPGPGPQTSELPPTSFNFRGDILRIDPHFDWGFRLGLGYSFSSDQWDARATWTSYTTSAHAAFASDGTSFAVTLWGHPDVTNSSASSLVQAHFALKYDTVDLDLGRTFGTSHCICLRPYFGIRVARIDQALTIFNQVALGGQAAQSLSTDLKARSDFTGAGLHFGLDGRLELAGGFSIYNLASCSLLYGRFDTPFEQSVSGASSRNQLPPAKNLNIADTSDHFYMGMPTLQMGLGLQWDRSFLRERCHLELRVGWEQNLYFQLNQMNHFQGALKRGILFQENGNFSLQGVCFGARLDF